VFELDARVLSEGSRLHRTGEPSFYGLQLADRLRVPKITVYRSLRRLTELGLVDRWWEDPQPTFEHPAVKGQLCFAA
jgi:hypothetical protein